MQNALHIFFSALDPFSQCTPLLHILLHVIQQYCFESKGKCDVSRLALSSLNEVNSIIKIMLHIVFISTSVGTFKKLLNICSL